jgi:hypothetical protein
VYGQSQIHFICNIGLYQRLSRVHTGVTVLTSFSAFSRYLSAVVCVAALGLVGQCCQAQANLPVYQDSLVSGFMDYGWAPRDYSSTAQVQSGSASLRVTAGPWEGIHLYHAPFDVSGYSSVTFWIHGGTTGQQRLEFGGSAGGVGGTPMLLSPLAANTWRQVTVTLADLGLAGKANFDGFYFKDVTGVSQSSYYIDSMVLTAVPLPATVNVNVNASQPVRTVDNRMFGLNSGVWESSFTSPDNVPLLREIDNKVLRFPGGSLSDEYHWATGTSTRNGVTSSYPLSFDTFAAGARDSGAQVYITVNYGSGTASEAADWVRASNVTKGYGFKYWEIGNEVYGSWEYDTHTRKNDAYTYAMECKNYIAAMKAQDPSIKVGVVVTTGEDSYANYKDHPATNPRTGVAHNGWTPVLLTTLRSQGVTPDFVVYHRYINAAWHEDDTTLLQSSRSWTNDIAELRQMLNDYLGAAAQNVEIAVTEHNSSWTTPTGKQTTSLVGGLFLADSLGQAMQTEMSTLVWWLMRSSPEYNGNNGAHLYGWRNYGSYGIISQETTGYQKYPTFYAYKLLSRFARGGDSIVQTNTSHNLLGAYAAKRTDGSLCLMVVNKSAGAAINANIAVTGFTPSSSATLYQFGKTEDNAAQTGPTDISQRSISVAGANFSYTCPPYSMSVIKLTAGSTTPPPVPVELTAPSNLQATAMSRSQINLTWSDNNTNESGFYIERSTNNVNFTQIASVGANVKAYSSTGLSRRTTYYYRVRAFSSSANSSYSNTASAKTF